MNKRNSRKNPRPNHSLSFFRVSEYGSPFDNILAAAGNIVVRHGLDRLSRDVAEALGFTGDSPEKQIGLERAQLSLRKLEADIAYAKRREAEAVERAEQVKLKQQKQSMLFELQIQEKELQLERARRELEDKQAQRLEQLVSVRMEPISGALEILADSGGLYSAVEHLEAYREWLGSLREGKVFLILGKRGSGKSAFTAKIGEFLMAEHGIPTYWVGAPESAQQLLPHWMHLVDAPEHCPANSFVMCDEAGVNYLSLLFNTTENRFMRRLLMIARQKRISLAFATQSSRDVDWSIVRQADSIIFREPGLHQPDSERPDVKSKAKKAALAFKEMPKEEKIKAAYIFDDDFEGIIKSNLPSFWTEDLSHIYAQLDLSQIENRTREKERLEPPIDAETKTLTSPTLERAIMELSQQGNGIQKTAKLLGCTTWTVRKCLDKYK